MMNTARPKKPVKVAKVAKTQHLSTRMTSLTSMHTAQSALGHVLLEVDRLRHISTDPETTPYLSKYKARELLRTTVDTLPGGEASELEYLFCSCKEQVRINLLAGKILWADILCDVLCDLLHFLHLVGWPVSSRDCDLLSPFGLHRG